MVVGCSVNPSIVWPEHDRGTSGEKNPGGYYMELSGTSADVALALGRAGMSAHLVGAVGPADDPFDDYLRREVDRLGLSATLLSLRAQNALASVEPMSGRALSAKPPIVHFEASEVRTTLDSISADVRIATGVMADPSEVRLAQMLLGHTAKLRILNPRQALIADSDMFISLLSNANWLIMNRHEAEAWERQGQRIVDLVDGYGQEVVVVTKDKDGAELWTPHCHLTLPAFDAGPVVHTTGAGDCFLAYFLVGFLRGGEMFDAGLRLATVAAGIKTTMPGTTSSPTLEGVYQRLGEYDFDSVVSVSRR